MRAHLDRVPTTESLQHGLTEALAALRPRVVERTAAARESTHPIEVVTCELGDGSVHRLLLKYSGFDQESYGHRRGVPYEGEVYRDVISQLDLPCVEWLGNYEEPTAGRAWVILRYAEGARRLSKSSVPLSAGARWIGSFHRATRLLAPALRLIRYDAAYYATWADRTLARAAGGGASGWLPEVCAEFSRRAGELAAWEPTVIHGEYYAKNILVVDGSVCPIDWESAAVGQGEVDLAALTEYWPPAVVTECEEAYVASRWPDGEPDGFRRVLWLSRIYVHLRWLAVVRRWDAPGTAGRLSRLRAEAERPELGL